MFCSNFRSFRPFLGILWQFYPHSVLPLRLPPPSLSYFIAQILKIARASIVWNLKNYTCFVRLVALQNIILIKFNVLNVDVLIYILIHKNAKTKLKRYSFLFTLWLFDFAVALHSSIQIVCTFSFLFSWLKQCRICIM